MLKSIKNVEIDKLEIEEISKFIYNFKPDKKNLFGIGNSNKKYHIL